ncbi:MAG: hypothetical protein AB1540_09165 [Bdellovibrionota bacterium]
MERMWNQNYQSNSSSGLSTKSLLIAIAASVALASGCDPKLIKKGGGGAASGGGGGTGGSSSNASAAASISDLNDEFDASSSISNWEERSVAEGGVTGTDGSSLISGGYLLLKPNANNYFYQGNRGLNFFKRINLSRYSRFIVEASVRAHERGSMVNPPPVGTEFHSAGLIIYTDLTDFQDWVVVNLGRQDVATGLGFESKNTVNNVSNLWLYSSSGENVGFVRLCVVDGNITTLTKLPADPAWTQRDTFTHAGMVGNNVGVGLMTNDYLTAVADMDGAFDYIRFREISDATECDRLSL